MDIRGAVVPGDGVEIESARIELLRNGVLLETLPAVTEGAIARATWPARHPVDPEAMYSAGWSSSEEGERLWRRRARTCP